MDEPTFDPETSTISIPENLRIYKIDGKVVTGDVRITKSTTVTVKARPGRSLKQGAVTSFTFDPDFVEVEEEVEPEEPVEDQSDEELEKLTRPTFFDRQ